MVTLSINDFYIVGWHGDVMTDTPEGEWHKQIFPAPTSLSVRGAGARLHPELSHHHIDNKIQTQDGAMEDRQKMDEGVRNFGSDLILLLLIFKSTLVSCNG